ncbi:MAG: hypothetical protein ACHREM_32420, partial [Polyangiales bacterium]
MTKGVVRFAIVVVAASLASTARAADDESFDGEHKRTTGDGLELSAALGLRERGLGVETDDNAYLGPLVLSVHGFVDGATLTGEPASDPTMAGIPHHGFVGTALVGISLSRASRYDEDYH